ncbi:YeeE/YedE thiosulfate transporter family protein [Rubritepida flocculans]|uniref:YeeE/YedE thiosulfate transporter family protein n=1 Tax=Rubritepida flocculans TaxID=182403 RepID=UPI0003FA5043|nr:YeeE/YedE thiosulfate transporter family protein [Rubritepida flocculans]
MFPVSKEVALWLAPVFGFAFGWLLERGRVLDYNVIVNQLRLRDFTVLKIMLTAILVGGVGVYALVELGFARWHLRDANLGGAGLGGLLFGVGMAIYGYCPGTGLAAAATGRTHALVGMLGMIAGAIAYAFAFDWLRGTVLAWSNLGRVTLADVTGLPLWALYAALAVVAVGLFAALERWQARVRA